MSTPQRIYVVRNLLAGEDAETGPPTHRLVRAPNAAQAVRHVAADTLSASVASQDDLVLLVGRGVKVEACGQIEQAEQPEEVGP
jgi:hypothetical protein